MANSILDPLVDKAGGIRKTAAWYRNAVASIADRATAGRLMRSGKLNGRPSIGRLNMYFYDPKTKDKLPYYDTFPLSVIVSKAPGGFYGLNLHYLAPTLRAKFLDALMDITNNKAYDDTTKFQARYNILQKTSKLRFYKPCFKHYLSKNVRSRFAYVPPPEWEIATFLPLANFEKASQRQVYKDSRTMVA